MSNASNVKIAEATATSSAVSSETYVRVTWRDMVITGGTLYIYTSYQVTAQAGSGGGEQEKNKRFRVWINDDTSTIFDQVGSLPNNQYTSISLPNNTPISKVRVNMIVTGNSYIAAGPSMTPDATAQFDYTANITQMGDNDFIFVKNTGTNNDGKYFLMLPDVTASIKARFIKIVGSGKYVWVLNNPSSDASMPDEIGDSGLGLGRSSLFFQDSYACLTLISDLTDWEIANYYPSNNQGAVPLTTYTMQTDPRKIRIVTPSAQTSSVFVFVTDSEGITGVGPNVISLNTPTSPCLCTIIYAGNASKSEAQNKLYISPIRNNIFVPVTIDGTTGWLYQDDPLRYIYADASNKSASIVLIWDGSEWLIVGYYFSRFWTWKNNVSPQEGGYHAIPANPQQSLFVPEGTLKYYYLPNTFPSDIPGYSGLTTYVMLVKKKYDTNTSNRIRFASYANGGSKRDRINTFEATDLYLGDDRDQRDMCLWLVGMRRIDTIDYIDWYPIIGYTPRLT